MKLIAFLSFTVAILFIIERAIYFLEALLKMGRGIINIAIKLLFAFFVLGVIFLPQEFGDLLQPILKHFSFIIEAILNTIWGIFQWIMDFPSDSTKSPPL